MLPIYSNYAGSFTSDKSQPLDSLEATFSAVSNTATVTASVQNPDSEKKYVLSTYLAEKAPEDDYIGADYLVDMQYIEDPTNITVTIPTTGALAPTGDYYISTFLMEEKTGDFDEEKEGDETALLTAGKVGSTEKLVHYTNDTLPGAPLDVKLEANGNETMVASWKAPTDGVTPTGYKITIYQEDENGAWEDTGFGYEYNVTDFGKINGLTYDETTGIYSIDMAVTAGAASYTDENGTVTDELLKANKNYKVGVTAYDLSRAMLCQILYNRAGRPEVTAENPFTDVLADQWYTDAVIWAYENKVVEGYGDGKFGPADSITREQLATILWRYDGEKAASASLDAFVDGDEVSSYALDALRWAYEKGIVTGREDGTLDPLGNATRAEVAAMVMRYLELK